MKIKKSLLSIILILMIFLGVNNVFAETLWVDGSNVSEYNGIDVRNKKIGSKIAFCISGLNVPANNGTTCTVDNTMLTNTQKSVVGQIISQKCPDGCTSFGTNYVIMEAAIAEYLQETSFVPVGGGVNGDEHPTLYSSAKELISDAKAASTLEIYESTAFNVEFNASSLNFTKDGNVYKSQTIKLAEIPHVDTSTINLSVTGVTGAKLVGDYTSFYVTIPVSNATNNSTVTVKTSTVYQKEYATVDVHDCEEGQDVVTLSTGKRSGSDSISGTITLGKLTVNKVDENNQPVKGAKIKITGPDNYSVEYVTDGTSKVLDNLTLGTYKIQEITAPSGYIIAGPKEVTLSATKLSETVSMVDKKTKVVISKVDVTTSKELPGATLQILDSNGKELYKWVSTDKPHEIEGIPVGKYKLKETIAPDGYVLNKTVVEFEVKADGTTTQVKMENKKTRTEISKVDITTGKELPGATLLLTNSTGTIKYKWISSTKPYVIDGLPAGKYTLRESVAPDGYALNETEVEFEVKSDGTTTKVKMENELIKVVINKVNAVNKTALPGATLQILDSEGNPILDKDGKELYKWESTEEPYVIEGLPIGKYKLKEISAPEGYVLNEKIIDFEIKNDEPKIEIEMVNELEVDVPDTLSSRSSLLIAISMFDIALGIGILTYVKKNKTEE